MAKILIPYLKVIDITGDQYGKWKVLQFSHINHEKQAMWECRCECGTIKVVRAATLRDGRSTTCGCGTREAFRLACSKPGVASFNYLYRNYRWAAQDRGFSFTLDFEQFKRLTTQNCHYCGQPPQRKITMRSAEPYVYNGIDRLNSALGYVIHNCVSCCKTCNFAKASMSEDEFFEWILRVAQHQKFI